MKSETFYARFGNLQMQVNPGRIEEVDGRKKTVGFKEAVFLPLTGPAGGRDGSGSGGALSGYGVLTTGDEEVIAFLHKHIENLQQGGQEPDIYTAAQFNDIIVPAKDKLASARREIEDLRRKLSMANQLTPVLQEQGIVPLDADEPTQPKRGPGRPRKTETVPA